MKATTLFSIIIWDMVFEIVSLNRRVEINFFYRATHRQPHAVGSTEEQSNYGTTIEIGRRK